MTTSTEQKIDSRSSLRDASGYAIFSQGDAGAAHAAAHEAFDSRNFDSGLRRLRNWLNGRTATDSATVHLYFHLALFELETGDWTSAYTRFIKHLLPAATKTTNALTDAPALLWRLALAAPVSVTLPWQPLRRATLAQLGRADSPFVELHHLLALAGARDLQKLESWLNTRPTPVAQREPRRLVERAGAALCAYVKGRHREAAARLEWVAAELPLIGGSAAQHQLFDQLVQACYADRCRS